MIDHEERVQRAAGSGARGQYALKADATGEITASAGDTGWMASASCRDMAPEIFFPTDGEGVRVAQAVCADCPVSSPCLEHAIRNHIVHGVWGGASERTRRRIARSRSAGSGLRRRSEPAGRRASDEP